MLKHEVLDCILLCADVVAAHEHGVVGHHLECPAGEGRAAEEGAAGIDALVVLGDQDVDVLDTEILGGVDVGGVLLKLAIKNRRVAHQAAFDGVWTDDFLDKIVIWLHHDNVGIDEPDPFGFGVEGEGFGDSRDLGPCLQHAGRVSRHPKRGILSGATYSMRLANIITTGVEPQVRIPMLCAVLLTVIQHTLEDVGNSAIVASAVTCSQDNDVAVPRIPRIALPPGIVRHLPIPLWLCLEVSGLRLVVLDWSWQNGFAWRVISVVVGWDVAEKLEEDY